MSRILVILEVSRKQDYIFSDEHLSENVRRSLEISYVTSPDFFRTLNAVGQPPLYADENLVYSGGGHVVLQFTAPNVDAARDAAKALVSAATEQVQRGYDGMELFARLMEHDENKPLSETFEDLIGALEQKKARRQSSVRRASFGVEKLDRITRRPVDISAKKAAQTPNSEKKSPQKELINPPKGWSFPAEFEKLCQTKKALGDPTEAQRSGFGWERRSSETDEPCCAQRGEAGRGIAPEVPLDGGYGACDDEAGEDNFLAVVHVDGNGMGKRVKALYERLQGAQRKSPLRVDKVDSWEAQCRQLHDFSEGIQKDFESAFSDVAEAVARLYPTGPLPIRPVVLAGDDVCFVTRGDLGLECGRLFLQALAQKRNPVDGKPYTACAGVAIVHLKYPFHEAYNLSEALCSNAKRFGAAYDDLGNLCAMDWHLEFGQMKESLSALRESYRTDDGCQMELRPVAVSVKRDKNGELLPPKEVPAERTYDYFCKIAKKIRENQKDLPRSKVKGLRNAIRQGEVEALFYAQKMNIRAALNKCMDKTPAEGQHTCDELLSSGSLFQALPEGGGDAPLVKRCLVFDAIELMDHFDQFPEKEEQQ